MYKSVKIGRLRMAINRFPKTAKNVSEVYKTGIGIWSSFEDNNYSLVIGRNRIIISINKSINTCGEKQERLN